MDPAWAIMDEKIHTDIERAERHAPDGGHSHKRDTCLRRTAIVVSDFDGMNFNNRRWLTSYHRRYAKSAAQCDEFGPRTYIRVAAAEFGYGKLEIQFMLPDDPPIATDHIFAKANLCPKSASQLVCESWTAEQYAAFCRNYGLHTGSKDGYSPTIKMTFPMKTLDFVYVSCDNIPFYCDRNLDYPKSIIRQSQETGTNFPEKHILVECFLPESCRSLSEDCGNTPDVATYLSRIIARAHNDPYGFFFKYVPERVFKSADDMPSIQECAFVEPDSPVDSFHSVMEQTARLSIVMRDELEFSRLSMLLAKQRAYHTFAFELPGHRVNGVVAGYFFVWPAPDLELVPQIGERFAIQLDDVPFRFAKSTATRDTNAHYSQQKRVITDHVAESCIAARVASRKAGRRIEDDIYDALDKIVKTSGNSDDRAKWIRSQITPLLFKEGTARKSLAIPAAPTETPTAHHSRVARWVDYMFERGLLHANGLCLSLTAVRVTVPSWMEPLGIVGAYVRAPAVPGWPQHQKPVPVVEFKIPCITIGSNLTETIQKVRSNRKKHMFTSRFIRTAHGGQLKAGLRALSRSGQDFAELSRTNSDAFARYIAKVRGDTISYDLTDALPLLKDFLNCADSNTSPEDPVLKAALNLYQKFDKDQKAMYNRVRNLPFGTCIVSGVPGSGKNHVTQLLMAIIQHSAVNDRVVRGWTGTEFPATVEPDRVKRHFSTSDRMQCASSGDLSKSPEAMPRHIGSTTQEETRQSQSPCMLSRSQLLIVAPSNDMLDKIADDLSTLYSKLGLEKRLCRVQTPDNAYEYMTDRMNSDNVKPEYDEEDHGEDAFETEVYLRTLSKDCQKKYRVKIATGGEYAVSALVAKRIEKAAPNDELVTEIKRLQKERKDKPESFFETGITELRELLQHASDEEYVAADVLLATPESFYKLAVRDVKLRIIAVWQDEAFRMTETEALIGLQFAREAFARFMTGDDKQYKPVVMSVNAHNNKNSNLVFCAQFGQQLELSLPSRMIKAGFRAHYLNINHRAK
ncbi:hypothetical protein E8E14_006161 [Neopestalotiopsis sp. 37M]|nr:hypothetical protein E8E14_006161 [Neopestalotiopsis sp. 37M]